MSRPYGPIPGPMPEAEMTNMCAITNDPDKDAAVYPNVDDKTELRVGDVVFFTATLVKEDKTTAIYSLPGTIVDKGEGKLAVRPCSTKLWELGWKKITEVMVDDADIRFVAKAEDLDDDQLISTHWENPVTEVAISCVDDLIKSDKNFKKYMGGYGRLKKDGSPHPSFKTPRCEFLCAVMEKMGNNMTLNDWRKQRPSNTDPPEVEAFEKWIDSNYISLVLAEKTSSITDETEKTKYKKEVSPTTKTTTKYMTMLMNIMIADCGPMPPNNTVTGGTNGGQDMKDILAAIKDLTMKLDNLQGSVDAMATQLQVRDTTNPPPKVATAAGAGVKKTEIVAKVVEVPGAQHECAYHVMSVVKAINDGTIAPAGPPVFSNTAVDAAKKSTLIWAKAAHRQDPKQTEAVLGFKIEKLYTQVLEQEQGEKTWAGEYHFILNAPEHPDVELKLKTFRNGKVATISTRQANLPPAKLVMFARWRPGHYEIIGAGNAGQTQTRLHAERGTGGRSCS